MPRGHVTSVVRPFIRADQDTLLGLLSVGGSIACSLAALSPMSVHAPVGLNFSIGVTNALLGIAILRWRLGSRSLFQVSILFFMVFELSVLITATHTQIGLATDLVALPWIAVYAACFATARSFFTLATVMTVAVITATALSSVSDPWFTTIRILLITWCASVALHIFIVALRRRAETDGLTQILNRNGFFRMAVATGVQRSIQSTFVVLLDLDGFKTINDQHGHIEGDEILRQTAKILKQHLPTKTILARIGGDEFAIVAVATESEVLLKQLQRLQSATPCTFSFGLVPWTDSSSLDEAMVLADEALYVDKRNHRSRFGESATECQPE